MAISSKRLLEILSGRKVTASGLIKAGKWIELVAGELGVGAPARKRFADMLRQSMRRANNCGYAAETRHRHSKMAGPRDAPSYDKAVARTLRLVREATRNAGALASEAGAAAPAGGIADLLASCAGLAPGESHYVSRQSELKVGWPAATVTTVAVTAHRALLQSGVCPTLY